MSQPASPTRVKRKAVLARAVPKRKSDAMARIAPAPAHTGTCELCATGGEVLRTSVVVRHERGGTVVLAACDRCSAAVRRLIALAGGAVFGGLGYLLGVRRYGPLPMIGVLAGAVAAGYLARWIGEQSGRAGFHHLLATLPAGAHLHDPLTLRATGAIAFWPLAAGLVAGGIEAFVTRRRRGAVG